MIKRYEIIVVDDDVEDRMLMQQSFTEAGINQPCQWLEDLPSLFFTLSECKSGQTLPLLIILDYIFPSGNGLDALMKIRAKSEYDSIPVLIFSDFLTLKIEREFLNQGALACTSKPDRYEKVIEWAGYVKHIAQSSMDKHSYHV